MTEAFHYIGIGTVVLAALAAIGFVLLIVAALWQEYGVKFICRRPQTLIVWSTFRSDIRTKEGRREKITQDIRVTRMIGTFWRMRWFFGLVVFEDDDGK
ncbi:hypothetical protein [Bradyrhizobium liaoningense]